MYTYNCKNCGKEFQSRNKNRAFCSPGCSHNDTKTTVDKICAVCGKSFRGYANRKVCSLACVNESMRLAQKECQGCGKKFAPEKSHTKFCTKECEIASNRKGMIEPPSIESARWIALTRGKFALIDEDDFERVSQRNWYAYEGKSTWYARSNSKCGDVKVVRLHRFILGVTDSKCEVDHIDQDGLNCRKSNLRAIDNSRNRMNTLAKSHNGYKGVTETPSGKFAAKIVAGSVCTYLGRFNTAEEAARAYDAEARKVHGEHGRYNFPLENEAPSINDERPRQEVEDLYEPIAPVDFSISPS